MMPMRRGLAPTHLHDLAIESGLRVYYFKTTGEYIVNYRSKTILTMRHQGRVSVWLGGYKDSMYMIPDRELAVYGGYHALWVQTMNAKMQKKRLATAMKKCEKGKV